MFFAIKVIRIVWYEQQCNKPSLKTYPTHRFQYNSNILNNNDLNISQFYEQIDHFDLQSIDIYSFWCWVNEMYSLFKDYCILVCLFYFLIPSKFHLILINFHMKGFLYFVEYSSSVFFYCIFICLFMWI